MIRRSLHRKKEGGEEEGHVLRRLYNKKGTLKEYKPVSAAKEEVYKEREEKMHAQKDRRYLVDNSGLQVLLHHH